MTTTPLGETFFRRHFPSRIKQHIRSLGHSVDELADVIAVVRDEFVCNAYHLEDFIVDAVSSHDVVEERAVDHIWGDLLPVISKAISDELKFQRKADASTKRKEGDKKRLREERQPKQVMMPQITAFVGATMPWVGAPVTRVVDIVVDNPTFVVGDDDLKLPPIIKVPTTTTQNEAI